MAERPAILRGLRAADAVALAACAVGDRPARRRRAQRGSRRSPPPRPPARPPTAGLLAFQRPGGTGLPAPPGRDRRPARPRPRARRRPRRLARRASRIVLARPEHARARGELRRAGRRRLRVQRPVGGVARRHQTPARRAAAQRLGAAARRRAARAPASSSAAPRSRADARLPPRRPLRLADPPARPRAPAASGVLRSERRALLLNPSFDGRALLYVRSTYTRQELRLGPLARRTHHARPRPLPHHPDRAPRRRPRAGPPPPPRRLPGRQAAAARARARRPASPTRSWTHARSGPATAPTSRGCGGGAA